MPSRPLKFGSSEIARTTSASDCPKSHAARAFIEGGFSNHLLQHLTVEAECTGLLHGDRPAELAANLLQLVGVEITELLRGDFGVADLGEARLSESLEDIGDTPDTETDDQDAEHDRHDRLAEPVR